jgi:hypothetical protein
MIALLLRQKVVFSIVDTYFPVFFETSVGVFQVNELSGFQHVESLDFGDIFGEVRFECL